MRANVVSRHYAWLYARFAFGEIERWLFTGFALVGIARSWHQIWYQAAFCKIEGAVGLTVLATFVLMHSVRPNRHHAWNYAFLTFCEVERHICLSFGSRCTVIR